MRTFFLCLLLWIALPLNAQQKEGGIIGTGVLGQITALGSIYVNGLHIRFDPDVETRGIASAQDLGRGMTVAAIVTPDGPDWRATSIRRIPALTGPITAPGHVMGVPVTGLDRATTGWVRIDGFWTTNGVQATRIAQIAPTQAEAAGPYAAGPQIGTLRFAGLTPRRLENGRHATIRGRYEDGAFQVDHLQKGLFSGPTPQLVLAQGYLSTPEPSGLYRLIGADAVSYTDDPSMAIPPTPVTLCALDGRLDFDAANLSPEAQQKAARLCEPN